MEPSGEFKGAESSRDAWEPHRDGTLSARAKADRFIVRVGIAVVLVVLQRVGLGYRPCDDAFIAFRCARNLVEHGTPVFNVEEPLFAATSLVHTMILAGAHAMGGSIPTTAAVLSPVFDLGVCLLLMALAWTIYRQPVLGMVAAAAWLLHPVVALNGIGGMETSLFVFLLLGTVWAVVTGRFGLAWFLAFSAWWVRIDGVALIPIVAWRWWRAGRPRTSRSWMAATCLSVLGYMTLTHVWFGTPVPHGVMVKAAATRPSLPGLIASIATFLGSLGGVSPVWFRHFSPHLLLVPGLWIALQGHLAKGAPRQDASPAQGGEKTLLMLAAFHAALFVLPARLNALLFPWYPVPFVTLAMLPALRGLQTLAGRLGRATRTARVVSRVALTLAMLWLARPIAVHLLLSGTVGWWTAFSNACVVPPPLAQGGDMPGLAAALPGLIPWIWHSVGLGLVALLVGLWWAAAASEPPRGDISVRRAVGGALLFASLLIPLLLSRADLETKYHRREAVYLAIGRWAASHLEPGSILGAREVGALGWAAFPLRIHDELGLVSLSPQTSNRATWVVRKRPALIVETSRSARPASATPRPLPGYALIQGPHNAIHLRSDLLSTWLRTGPPLR